MANKIQQLQNDRTFYFAWTEKKLHQRYDQATRILNVIERRRAAGRFIKHDVYRMYAMLSVQRRIMGEFHRRRLRRSTGLYACQHCGALRDLEFLRLKRNPETGAPEGMYCCDCYYGNKAIDGWNLTGSPYRKIGKRKPALVSEISFDDWFNDLMQKRDGRLGFNFKLSYSQRIR